MADIHEKATIDNVAVGDELVADDGFTCLKAGARVTVSEEGGCLFVSCISGKHFLDGQLDDGAEYIGFSKVSA